MRLLPRGPRWHIERATRAHRDLYGTVVNSLTKRETGEAPSPSLLFEDADQKAHQHAKGGHLFAFGLALGFGALLAAVATGDALAGLSWASIAGMCGVMAAKHYYLACCFRRRETMPFKGWLRQPREWLP